MTVFLGLPDVLEIHRKVIEATGGSEGLCDAELVDSAVHRPQATFAGQPLYSSLPEQAAALFHSLVLNHPFLDGNKRTAFTALDVFLRLNGACLDAPENDKYDFVMQVASGQMSFAMIVSWIAGRLRTTPDPGRPSPPPENREVIQ